MVLVFITATESKSRPVALLSEFLLRPATQLTPFHFLWLRLTLRGWTRLLSVPSEAALDPQRWYQPLYLQRPHIPLDTSTTANLEVSDLDLRLSMTGRGTWLLGLFSR